MNLDTRINELIATNRIRGDRPGPRQRLIDLIKKIYNSLENSELFLQFLDPKYFSSREYFVTQLNNLDYDLEKPENANQQNKQNILQSYINQLNENKIRILRSNAQYKLSTILHFNIISRINVELYESGLLGDTEEKQYTTILKIVDIYEKIFRYYNLFYDFLDPENFEDFKYFNEMLDKLDTALQERNNNEKEILENIFNTYQTIQVRNHEGQLETRRVLVPRTNIFINTEIINTNNEQNLNPPQRVPYQEPHHFDGMCNICFDSFDPLRDYCKVNCPAGHTFHCDCISEYFNHKKNRGVVGYFHEFNDFNDQCPMCKQQVTTISKLPSPLVMINKFGKKRKNGQLSDLEYLLKLKCF
jgi:hypothetical protein